MDAKEILGHLDEKAKAAPRPPEFRGLTIAIAANGRYSVNGSAGVTTMEIYGVLSHLLKKMEKDLGSA